MPAAAGLNLSSCSRIMVRSSGTPPGSCLISFAIRTTADFRSRRRLADRPAFASTPTITSASVKGAAVVPDVAAENLEWMVIGHLSGKRVTDRTGLGKTPGDGV